MPARRYAIAAVVIVVLIVAWFSWPAATPRVVSRPQPPVPAVSPTSAHPGDNRKTAMRTSIPRAVRTNTGGSPPAGAPVPADAPEAEAVGPTDRREPAPENGWTAMAAIKGKMDEVTDDIAACLGEWMAIDPSLEGKVSMGFRLGPEGLQEAWVVDHTDVPFGPLSCFGTAVDSADWSGVTEKPIEVTFPFVFTQGNDAGDEATPH